MNPEEKVRIKGIELFKEGINPTEICRILNRTKPWFYKWLNRYKSGEENWFKEVSRAPHSCNNKLCDDLERKIRDTRKRLMALKWAQIGANSIRLELIKDKVSPIPSFRTINRVIKRNDLIPKKERRSQPKGKAYPTIGNGEPNDVHQFDIVGPRYLGKGIRFYAANSIDVGSHRINIKIIENRTDVSLANAIVDSWFRLGLPRYLQMDNFLALRGSNRYPHSFGIVIRLCLHLGIQPVFIPLGEPWRNGVIEHFQDVFDKRFFRMEVFNNVEQVQEGADRFQDLHDSNYIYSCHKGKTPMQVIESSSFERRFLSETFEFPDKLYIEPGFIHFIRFIRSNLILDIFGEKFKMPEKAQYEYVKATINTKEEFMTVNIDEEIIFSHKYKLPKTPILLKNKL